MAISNYISPIQVPRSDLPTAQDAYKLPTQWARDASESIMGGLEGFRSIARDRAADSASNVAMMETARAMKEKEALEASRMAQGRQDLIDSRNAIFKFQAEENQKTRDALKNQQTIIEKAEDTAVENSFDKYKTNIQRMKDNKEFGVEVLEEDVNAILNSTLPNTEKKRLLDEAWDRRDSFLQEKQVKGWADALNEKKRGDWIYPDEQFGTMGNLFASLDFWGGNPENRTNFEEFYRQNADGLFAGMTKQQALEFIQNHQTYGQKYTSDLSSLQKAIAQHTTNGGK